MCEREITRAVEIKSVFATMQVPRPFVLILFLPAHSPGYE